MQFQAENLRIYALAYPQWRKPEYLKAALAIHRYLASFLMSPEGASTPAWTPIWSMASTAPITSH